MRHQVLDWYKTALKRGDQVRVSPQATHTLSQFLGARIRVHSFTRDGRVRVLVGDATRPLVWRGSWVVRY